MEGVRYGSGQFTLLTTPQDSDIILILQMEKQVKKVNLCVNLTSK